MGGSGSVDWCVGGGRLDEPLSAVRLRSGETNSSVVPILCGSLPLILALSIEKDRSEEAMQGPSLINYLII